METQELVEKIERDAKSIIDSINILFDEMDVDDLSKPYLRKLLKLNDAICDRLEID